jgi:hypothetical protein
MAQVTKDKLTNRLRPKRVAGLTRIEHKIGVESGYANSGDNIEFFDLPDNAVIVDAYVYHDGSLGGGVTAQLKAGSQDLTATTSAGGADTKRQADNNTRFVDVGTGNQTVQVAIAGGNIGASANLWVGVVYDAVD